MRVYKILSVYHFKVLHSKFVGVVVLISVLQIMMK